MPLSRTTYTASIFFTCSLTLDRYLKIKYALRYNQLFSTQRLIVHIVSIWCTAVIVSVLAALPLFLGVSRNLSTRIEIIIHRLLHIGMLDKFLLCYWFCLAFALGMLKVLGYKCNPLVTSLIMVSAVPTEGPTIINLDNQ